MNARVQVQTAGNPSPSEPNTSSGDAGSPPMAPLDQQIRRFDLAGRNLIICLRRTLGLPVWPYVADRWAALFGDRS